MVPFLAMISKHTEKLTFLECPDCKTSISVGDMPFVEHVTCVNIRCSAYLELSFFLKSVEVLYHYMCDSCHKWWSSKDGTLDIMNCPYCGSLGRVK